jgi:hypothetical protein
MFKRLMKSNTKKSNTKKSNTKKSNTKKSNTKKSNTKIPTDVLTYELSNFLDTNTLSKLSKTNKQFNTLLKNKINNKKKLYEIENALLLSSNDIFEIVQQYYWKKYKNGKKYEEIYETSNKHYEEFIELYENKINNDVVNHINFIKNKINYKDLPDAIREDVVDKNLTVIIIYNIMDIFYNKKLLDKKSELYNIIIQKL